MFELTKRKAFTYAVNHLRWREVGLFSRECHRVFRAVFPMRVFANNVSLLFVFRRFAHLNTLNDSNGLVKLLEHGHSTPATGQTKRPGEFSPPGLLILLTLCCFPALAGLSAGCQPEFSELGGVTDLRDEPGLRAKTGRRLLLDAAANWRRPKGDRVTGLCYRDVVLSPVLAEEKSLLTMKKACQVQAAYRHVDVEFHLLCFLSFLASISRTV